MKWCMTKRKLDSERTVGSWAKARELITDPTEEGKRMCPTEISHDADHHSTSIAETKPIHKLSEIFELH
jgi:hypothetical protein